MPLFPCLLVPGFVYKEFVHKGGGWSGWVPQRASANFWVKFFWDGWASEPKALPPPLCKQSLTGTPTNSERIAISCRLPRSLVLPSSTSKIWLRMLLPQVNKAMQISRATQMCVLFLLGLQFVVSTLAGVMVLLLYSEQGSVETAWVVREEGLHLAQLYRSNTFYLTRQAQDFAQYGDFRFYRNYWELHHSRSPSVGGLGRRVGRVGRGGGSARGARVSRGRKGHGGGSMDTQPKCSTAGAHVVFGSSGMKNQGMLL